MAVGCVHAAFDLGHLPSGAASMTRRATFGLSLDADVRELMPSYLPGHSGLLRASSRHLRLSFPKTVSRLTVVDSVLVRDTDGRMELR